MRYHALSLVLCLPLAAQQLTITSGLTAHRVLQRGADGTGSATVSGTAPDGKIEARWKGHGWSTVATAASGKWTGEIKGIPMGGPHRIEFRAGKTVEVVDDVLVGDLWILAGQSNMEGVGDLVNVQPPDPQVHSFDMFDEWVIAKEPLHNLPGAVDSVHWGRNGRLTGEALAKFNQNRKKGAGLGLPFAVEMAKRTGVPIGLVPCAHGGTSMDQWSPDLKDKAGASLYGAMVRRFQAVGGRVTGVLWYQGESDANATAMPVFQEKFERLVKSVRADFGQPELPFYWVQIGRHVSESSVAEWNAVQQMQLKAEAAIAHSGMVPAADVALDDGIHVSTQDQKRIGVRLANLARHEGKRGPRPVSATVSGAVVKVTFSEVNGKLTSAGRPTGFSISSGAGPNLPLIFRIQFDPADGNVVLLHIGGKMPENPMLWYGRGKDPYVNVTDSNDMGMPVFGPMAITN